MHHDTPLISTIVAGLVLAYIFGMIANRFKMPPLVGYLFAGILVGPHTPGFVADQALGAELAEMGVILLMFGVGLHFSLKDLMSVRALAIPGAIAQITLATELGAGLGLLLGWELGGALLFGLALSVASTVVLLKALQDRRLIESERGRIAVGWLIVEDLAMVLALLLIPAIASLGGTDTGVHDPFVSFVTRLLGVDVGIWGILALTLVKIAAFVGFMLVVGRRVIPWALHGTAHTGSRELFRLAVLAIALGVALGSAVLFGVSLALGAFFAGMILSESELSHRAANETLPLRDAFAVLFFVSVGMLFDPAIIITQPLLILATVFIIMVGKSLAAFGIVVLFRRPVSTALTISASLAQIGEFSFILASMGVALSIMPPEGQDLILAGALISIVLNPAAFWVAELMRPGLEARFGGRKADLVEPLITEPIEPTMAAAGPVVTDAPTTAGVDIGAHGADDDTGEPTRQTDHTVLVGYGQVGRIVAAGIKEAGGRIVIIEDSDQDVAAARAEGHEVVFGNAASPDVLKLANLPEARNLLVAISNGFEAGSVCESGRRLNPGIAIIARAYSEEEENFLRSLGADTVIRGEQEIGKGILAFLRDNGGGGIGVDTPKLPEADNILAQAAIVGTTSLEPEMVEEVMPFGEAVEEDPVAAETEIEPVPAPPSEIDVVEAIVREEPLEAATETVDEPVVPPAVIEIVVDIPKVDEPVVEPESTVATIDEDAGQVSDEINLGSEVPDAASGDKEDMAAEDAAVEVTDVEPEAEAEEKKQPVPEVAPEPKP
ncbi:MAG: sodium:proton antiporter [Phyllobacteriaceae bacterium]|nr:sodium:proton antiporter [Phyllobacteriaceae bacterium]